MKELINSVSIIDTSGVAKFTGIGKGGVGADGPMSDIATAMVDFSTKVSGIDTAAVSTASSSALRLKTLINGLVDLDTSGIDKFKPGAIGAAMKTYMDKDFVALEEVNKHEDNVDEMVARIEKMHLQRLMDGIYPASVGQVYQEFASDTERIADHFLNVAKSIRQLHVGED